MKGAGVLTVMLMLSLAIFAYAEAAQSSGYGSDGRHARQSSGWFGRTTTCGWNRHWSYQYGKCIQTTAYKPLD